MTDKRFFGHEIAFRGCAKVVAGVPFTNRVGGADGAKMLRATASLNSLFRGATGTEKVGAYIIIQVNFCRQSRLGFAKNLDGRFRSNSLLITRKVEKGAGDRH